MCGIFGFTALNDNTRPLVPLLAFAMEDRGRCSWGVTNGVQTHRSLGLISDSLLVPDWEGPVVYHTRASTVGATTLPNQHPFEFTGAAGHVIGVHNGGVSNWAALNRIHGRTCEVDSMHIFSNIANNMNIKIHRLNFINNSIHS